MSLNRLKIGMALVMVCVCAPVGANSTFAKNVGDATGPLVAVGIAATYLGSGNNAQAKAARVADAAVVAYGAAKLMKPNMNVNDNGYIHSFPSGHTAVAFATATALADLHPKKKWLFYAGAALIGWSRVESDAHTWGDVFGGAAIGFGAGRLSMTSRDGLIIGRVYRF